ncbi:cAMP-binding domain of CRP or a regulatory subunit of cAMP-dependent protein kinases [Devosia enhydra]|uniref:cAMP-binding domain of CRP or a regulatory subunit of cAMP-dependent protein kinases n=1 Tax=Devosia enhydra TaxID=665118 RepID=A0A1K2HSF6_9HYPH|nr:Crp/Fnr family transcriptional regulator [Devosia enhydra]SFZ80797.1 cAMP-binding domain of CRP or a regulatory subunit of cAMP-dependent protein kinases [Devosia enhydra]
MQTDILTSALGDELSDPALEMLRPAAVGFRELEGGEDLEDFSQDHLHLVCDGWVYQYATLSDGRWVITRLATRGEMITPPRTGDDDAFAVAAMGSASVLVIDRAALSRLYRDNSIRNMMLKRRRAEDDDNARWHVMCMAGTAIERMAFLFLNLAERARRAGIAQGWSFPFPATQAHLAALTGLSAVHTNRTLQVLRQKGLLNWDGRRVDILAEDRLRALGSFSTADENLITAV